jgi:hypothetical protein
MLFFDIVSCFTYPAFMDRMAVVISFLALPIVCGKYRCTYGGKIILTATTVVYALLLIYYLNALVSHETFYGVDFYKILWSFVPS